MSPPSPVSSPSRSALRRTTRRAAVVLTAVAALALTGTHPAMAPPAEAATTVLRPDSDITNTWQVAPIGAAYAAVDDPVTQPTAVPATDWLYAGAAGRAVELGMSSTPVGTNVITAARVWFHANTGPGTQLRVEALWGGEVRASTAVPVGQGFAWRSLAITPSAPSDVTDLRLRFTAVGGGDTNLRAVYTTLDTAPPAAPLRTLTWDNGTSDEPLAAPPQGWNPQYSPERPPQLVTSTFRAGSRAARFELRTNDPWQNESRRAELTTSDPEAVGAGVERWYGFSVLIPPAAPAVVNVPETLVQWHQVANDGSPPLSIGTRNGQWEVAVFNGAGQTNNFTLGAYPTDRWTDWVVRVRWTSATDGLIEIWRDGVVVFSRYGVSTNYDNRGVYPKLGIYRWTWKNAPSEPVLTRVVFHDEMRIGNSAAGYAGVVPR